MHGTYTSDLHDFNRGTICSQGGLPTAAMLGPGGPFVAATLGPPGGTDYGLNIDGMTGQARLGTLKIVNLYS